MNTPKVNPLVKKEKEVQKFWEDNKIFEKTLEATKGGETYSFYDGPPFATGTPHYGHLVASIMKDVVPRYQTMRGKYIERKWGWDCHGLPIENIVEKELKLDSRKDIEEFGIDKFNEEARKNVLIYADAWKKTIPRLGRWVDMENDYKTMEPWYMESIWWAFKELWNKDLIYQGHKSMHVCPRCETTLSNFEVTQGYKDIEDMSTTWKFKVVGQDNTYFLAWTTVPWSTLSTMGLAVGSEYTYLKVKVGDEFVIFVKDQLEEVMDEVKDYEIIEEIKGKDLVGLEYEHVVDFYKDLPEVKGNKNVYHVFATDYVEVTEGTGIVTINGSYGEVDMQAANKIGLPIVMDVDINGHMNDYAKDYAGMYIKKAEKKFVEDIKKKGLIWKTKLYTHSYPHCWRCDTPLLNYATSSWFMKVTEIKKDLIKNNKKVHWVPEHIKEGRFGKWLEDARDWAISRSRYWGTPLPVWQCECGENKVIGSIKELEKETGQKVKDLHKHIVDSLVVKCDKCGKEAKRILEVLDCWFESGSMPYAQFHYPFENKEKFEKSFPAQFIAEGPDQTRGWFYTLMVLSTALFGKEAFENVIVNGIVLAEDGKKMSKRLQNYPEPDLVMEQYGADAVRYYLLSSPVMAAENLNFSEPGVKEAYQKVVMLLNNVVKFYGLYGEDKQRASEKSGNVLDQWIIAKLNILIRDVTKEMDEYHLSKSARPIQGFIDELSTWWLRRSRDRLKGEDVADKKKALETFKYELLELTKVMAPFTPFIAEYVYKEIGGELESVHLESWPKFNNKKIDQKALEEMNQARQVVEAGLASRAEAEIKIRQPLGQLTVKGFKLSAELSSIVADEVNVKSVVCTAGGKLSVKLDTKLTDELKAEGVLRELVRTINGLRRKQGLTIEDRVKVLWQSDGAIVKSVFADDNLMSELKKSVLADKIATGGEREVDINGELVKLSVQKA